jgi:hypothetical protein
LRDDISIRDSSIERDREIETMMPCHRHPMIRHAILLLALQSIISSCCNYFVVAHPALPIPNARPPKKLFAETNANAGSGDNDGSILHQDGKSSSSTNGLVSPLPPPSQIESIVANAKSLTVNWSKKNMDLTNPTLRSRYITALTAGLAVSLAMVPEAVSFSCECQKRKCTMNCFIAYYTHRHKLLLYSYWCDAQLWLESLPS